MRFALLGWCLGCPSPATESGGSDSSMCAGERQFGVPNENTGLDSGECAPECSECGDGSWGPPTYDAGDFADWRAWTLSNPIAAPTTDPYADTAEPALPSEEAVCGFVPTTNGSYSLADFDSTAAAAAAGAKVTHFGACGTCSPLADLAVYAETPDLTEPVRACGLEHMDGDQVALTSCIATLGFTEACASTWAWNTLHTREVCLAECLAALDQPYNNPDGSLNACLQCDEDQSGDVFKFVAGRTRRNTGLASSICRPCAEVRPLEHTYGAP